MNGKATIGCISLVLTLFVTLPIWLILMYQIIHYSLCPPWVGVLFWVYAPVSFIVHLLLGVAKILFDE